MTEAQQKFAARIVRRKKLFLTLSVGGLAVAFSYAVLALWLRSRDPGFALGPRLVIVLLILLNARQNLRQYKVAGILEEAPALLPVPSEAKGGA